jgi:hypothetical protein
VLHVVSDGANAKDGIEAAMGDPGTIGLFAVHVSDGAVKKSSMRQSRSDDVSTTSSFVGHRSVCVLKRRYGGSMPSMPM